MIKQLKQRMRKQRIATKDSRLILNNRNKTFTNFNHKKNIKKFTKRDQKKK